MANQSIKNAFERMWHHVTIALSNKSDSNHTHDYAPSIHSHDYLPLTGGDLNGELNVNGTITTNESFTVGSAILTWDSTKEALVISFD